MPKLSSLAFLMMMPSTACWSPTALAASDPKLPLPEGSHCVAYKVVKTMFLISSDEVIGKNCDVSAQILPEVGGLYHIEVQIPIRSFDSGNEDRDKDVVKILKGDQRPEMTFKSKAYTVDGWKDLFAKGEFPIEGELFIGSKSFPLTLYTTYKKSSDQDEVDGAARVKFKDFDMEPPKAGGGMVAKAKPEFDLYFHLQSQRILGADSIRLGVKDPEKKDSKQ